MKEKVANLIDLSVHRIEWSRTGSEMFVEDDRLIIKYAMRMYSGPFYGENSTLLGWFFDLRYLISNKLF